MGPTPLPLETPHYLVVGHVTLDRVAGGHRLGGTAAFAALAAQALGGRTGLVTACADDLDLGPLRGIACARAPSPASTTFENLYGPGGRTQFLRARAAPLSLNDVPESWRGAPIVHLAPLAGEMDTELARAFPGAFVGLTPQGWLRQWDAEGRVSRAGWPEAQRALPRASAAVLSIEDLGGDWALAEHWASLAPVLVVTQGSLGCTVFTRGGGRRQVGTAPRPEVDPTGAGDIFAAVFFHALHAGGDPLAAADFANQAAALSVTRPGLDGVPRAEELRGLDKREANA